MTDDEFLKLCRVASKTQQMKVLLMTTTLVEYKRRRKKARQNRQQTPATADSVETQAVKPAPAPLVVIPTPVEEKPLDTLEILDTDDDATKMRKLLARQAKERARCNNNAVQNDEDILRGKIKPDED